MGTFDSFNDAPFQIKTEGELITLTFSRGVPATGQGTAQWNIPAPANGCQTADEGRGAYCGIVILLHTSPLLAEHSPVDGTLYTPDPTANTNLHVGDRIGDALVVGAFYEGEKKGRDEELTTSLIITDLDANTPYFVAGYAVDCQGRYHRDGVAAYAREYGNVADPNNPSIQPVLLNNGEGALASDGTGLLPGVDYEFDLVLDENFPEGPGKTLRITIDGANAGTYGQLIDEMNKQIGLFDNPVQSPVPPNTGLYYWDVNGKQLYLFDGTNHNPVDALYEPTDPSVVATGTYWYDPTNDVLQRWDTPNPGVWNTINVVKYHQDPLDLECDDYWFDGTQGYVWNNTTWCELPTLVDTVDPSLPVDPGCGAFWYDTTNLVLSSWNTETSSWDERSAIYWPDAPNALAANTYWFDLDTNTLSQWSGAAWAAISNVSVQEDEPTTPLLNDYWFNPATEELKQWNGAAWIDLDVLVWAGDPTNVESCDLWWRSTDEVLFVWDTVNNEWDQVNLTQSDTDPSLAPTLLPDTLWYNPTTEVLNRWDGTNWLPVTFINYPTDPTQPATGDAWYNTETNSWYIWDTPVAGWNLVNPTDSDSDPSALPANTFWYDSANNNLYTYVGATWVSVPFSTMPFTPAKGATWYDSTTGTLMEWDGTAWVPATPLVTAALDEDGHLRFTSTATGSCVCVMIPTPDGFQVYGTGHANFAQGEIGSGYASGHHGDFLSVQFPSTDVTEQDFLFNNLPNAKLLRQVYGSDSVDGLPSYDQIDVGDDGSPDERRELMDSIRAQLGHPVVQVELTPYQLDTAVQAGLEALRKRSSIAYRRGFFFLQVKGGQQRYTLTNRKIGFHKIVTVTAAYRFTSAFLSSSHGAGVYGQVVLQHLYNMGTYDLTSYHLVSQYIEQLEHLFATRLTFHWDEPTRNLDFYHSFVYDEKVLLDCSIERTEQELLKDRWCKTWIERFALAQARLMLAEIRGKYASLPGAGGGISLNASDLITRAEADIAECYEELDDFVANDIEDWGMGTTLVIG